MGRHMSILSREVTVPSTALWEKKEEEIHVWFLHIKRKQTGNTRNIEINICLLSKETLKETKLLEQLTAFLLGHSTPNFHKWENSTNVNARKSARNAIPCKQKIWTYRASIFGHYPFLHFSQEAKKAYCEMINVKFNAIRTEVLLFNAMTKFIGNTDFHSMSKGKQEY